MGGFPEVVQQAVGMQVYQDLVWHVQQQPVPIIKQGSPDRKSGVIYP